jgi:two-component system alkaline phosphatase synthesis response regulator PhoP
MRCRLRHSIRLKEQAVTKILVVDDEETMVRSLSTLLRQEGYEVAAATDGQQALDTARAERPDLILLDVMLPGVDGVEVCRQVRVWSTVPIIMLTAKTAEVDKVVGLEVGADDYVTKPFSGRELVARVRANLRRLQMDVEHEQQERFQRGDVVMDVGRRRVVVRGLEAMLSPKEFDLLKVLMSHPGRVLGRDFLLNQVWGEDFFGDTRTLDVHIRWLREKIEETPSHPTYIQTVHGVGYRFQG